MNEIIKNEGMKISGLQYFGAWMVIISIVF